MQGESQDMAKGIPVEFNDEETQAVLAAFGVRIRKLRGASGLTQRQFAEATEISQSHIVTIEAGGPNVSIGLAAKMAKVLGVPLAALFEESIKKDAVEPILAKVAVELGRVAKAMDLRRDQIGTLLDEIEERLGDKTRT